MSRIENKIEIGAAREPCRWISVCAEVLVNNDIIIIITEKMKLP